MARRMYGRRPRRLAVAPGLILLLALWIVLTSRSGDPALYPPAAPADAVTIYMVDNGFHSDLVVPLSLLQADRGIAGAAAITVTNKPWVMVGWGDAHYYTGAAFSISRAADAVRAAVAPNNPSVVHLEGLPRSPDRVFVPQSVRRIVISNRGLAEMLGRLNRSFVADAKGAPVRVTTAVDPDEGFFQSTEHFSVVHLCNHWTAELLNAAGLPVTPVIDTIPAGLKLDLRLRAKA